MLTSALMLLVASAGDRPYLDAALQAAKWIRTSTVATESGAWWPPDPLKKGEASNSLYDGNPGVILFLLEAHRSTGDPGFLADARSGADYLLAKMAEEKENGLYVGIAGIGYTLEEVYKATKAAKYREGAKRCVKLLGERAKEAGKGIQWGDSTDIVSGAAGTGLFLLHTKDKAALGLAKRAGDRLIELGRPEKGGLKWSWSADPNSTRLMPNFSHGTAGISYFLARLYQETKDKKYLEAALAGGRYLREAANDSCLIFHNDVNGKELYYLGWCHGPVGTARLFYLLSKITGDKAWMERVDKSADAMLKSGIPEQRTPGFWNNVSQCCGSAGVADFFLSLYQITKSRKYLDFCNRVTTDLLARASKGPEGMRWVQAENRTQPDNLIAQTGYMQGAAGIGMWLLRFDSFHRGKKRSIMLPDCPW